MNNFYLKPTFIFLVGILFFSSIVLALPNDATTKIDFKYKESVNYTLVNVNNSNFLLGYTWETNPYRQWWYNQTDTANWIYNNSEVRNNVTVHIEIVGSTGIPFPASGDDFIIENNASNPGMSFLSNSSNTAGYIIFGDTVDNDVGTIRYSHNDDFFHFKANGVEDVCKIGSTYSLIKGDLGIGTVTEVPAGTLEIKDTTSQILSTSTASSSATAGAGAILYSNDGVALANGDRLGYFLFGGYDGGTTRNSAGVQAYADGAWSSGNYPSKFTFEVAGATGAYRNIRQIITNAGVIINTTLNVTNELNVVGSANIKTNLTVEGNVTIEKDVNISGNVFIGGNVSIKRPYGVYSSTETQTAGIADTAYEVTFNWTEDAYEIQKKAGNSNFTFEQSGDYLIELSAITTTDTANKHVEVWFKKNGVNIPRSNTKKEFTTPNAEYVLSVPFIIDMNKWDNLTIMYASDDAGSQLVYTPATAYSPESPSIVMTINKISEVTP